MKAINEGSERMPSKVCISRGKYEMVLGSAVIDLDKCACNVDCVSVCP